MKCWTDWMVIRMIKKYIIEEKHADIINHVREEQHLKNDSAAIRFILDEYEKNSKEKENDMQRIEVFLEAYHKKYYSMFERLRWASQVSEMNTTMILDAVNTMLITQDIENPVLTEAYLSPVLDVSKSSYKEKIAYFKQKKDDRKKGRKSNNLL